MLPVTIVLPILQARAKELGTAKGHVFGVWQPAKRRHGKAAVRAVCERCGMHVVATPYGDASATTKWLQEHPGVLGNAVFEQCVSAKVVELPTTLGLRGV